MRYSSLVCFPPFAAMAKAIGLGWLLLPSVLRLSASDTLDIDVTLYVDGNCITAYTSMLLLDDGCYANMYTNLTKAFKLKIVGFTGVSRYDLYDYTDACYSQFSPKRTLVSGKCERFVGGYYASLKSRLRSTTCVGESCSRLAVTTQRFFSEANCMGLPYMIYTYPVQNECMRWSNGTQAFRVDPTTTNVTQVDYLANDKCNGDQIRSYVMSVGYCYELYPDEVPRSFKWDVERYDATTVGQARLGGPSVFLPLLAAPVLLGHQEF